MTLAVPGAVRSPREATYENGAVDDFTSSSGWSSNNTPVAAVGASTGLVSGAVTGQSSGTTRITAEFSDYDYTYNSSCPETLVPGGGSGTANVAPAILFGGNDITGTTQSVVVGQQIALTASYGTLPSGVTVSSQSWSVGGTIVGGYTPTAASYGSGSVTAATLNQKSTTFYWAYPGNSFTVTYTLNLSNGQSPPATATFNVTGPSGVTMTSTAQSQLWIDDWTSDGACVSADPYLVYGNVTWSVSGGQCLSSGTYGFTASPSGTASGGTLFYVQIVNSGSNSGGLNCTIASGLDSGYPYPYIHSGNTLYDFPAVELKSSYTSQYRTEQIQTYLMWQSNATNSIPVPIGSQVWTFTGKASCSASCGSAGNWAITSSSGGTSGGFVTAQASQTNYGYPTWIRMVACN
jgi:hypothetical protein